MEEIIQNEFIAYKAGFIDGEGDALLQIHEANGDNVFLKENFSTDETWYSRGYDDGFNTSIRKYLRTKKMPVMNKEKTNKKIKEFFAIRIIAFNQNNNKMIPVAKFRI